MESFAKIVPLLVLGAVTLVRAQYYQDYTTPVPILKQINRHNEDGSYSYGYEAADGSFKIETKHPTGEVVGKYGYVDDTGNLREVEYGASRRGFEPAGTGINVAPPTLTQDSYSKENSLNADYDDGQYREDPSVYYKNEGHNNSPARKIFNSRPSYNSQPSYSSQRSSYNPPAPRYDPPAPKYNAPAPQYNPPAPQYNPPARQYNPPAPQYNPPAPQYNPPAPRYNPAPQYNAPAQQSYQPSVDPNQFRGHPASNFDVYSGSYSVTYSG